MKKLFMVCTLVLLVLTVTTRTQAAPTITYEEVRAEYQVADTVNAVSGQDDTYFVPAGISDDDIWRADDGKYYRNYFRDWGWTHTFADPAALLPATIDVVNWATLAIRAYDVDGGEMNVISSDGTVLGALTGKDSKWSTSVINLTGSVLTGLVSGTVDIWVDIDSTHNYDVWRVALGSSTLTVNYDTVELIEVEVPCAQTIPAPGAILLGSIGAGVVGWLRRRKTL